MRERQTHTIPFLEFKREADARAFGLYTHKHEQARSPNAPKGRELGTGPAGPPLHLSLTIEVAGFFWPFFKNL